MESKILGSVGDECVTVEALLCLQDKFYANNQKFPPIKKIRSNRSKRTNFHFLESSPRHYEGVRKTIVKKKRINRALIVDFQILDTNNDGQQSRSKGTTTDNQEQEVQPEMPAAFRETIERMEGSEIKLVIQKKLTESDMNPKKGRFAIPEGKINEGFITAMEESSLKVRQGTHYLGMSVSVLDPNVKVWDGMRLKKWFMDPNFVYNITTGWNKLVEENDLKVNQKVQLWSFRTNHQLCFALVKI